MYGSDPSPGNKGNEYKVKNKEWESNILLKLVVKVHSLGMTSSVKIIISAIYLLYFIAFVSSLVYQSQFLARGWCTPSNPIPSPQAFFVAKLNSAASVRPPGSSTSV